MHLFISGFKMKKKRVIGIALTALAVLLAEQIFFLLCGFGLPMQFGDTFMGELKSKYERLRETSGKRIVLVGGSSVAFGSDSHLLTEMFPEYEVVNFGMYAGLGTKAVLELSEGQIRAGDIVILSPEQDAQTLSLYFNGEYMWQAADGAFEMLKDLKWENLEQMLGTFPGFAMEKLSCMLKNQIPQTDSVYRRSSFNTYGDIELEVCKENIMPSGYDINQPVYFSEDVVQKDFLKYMNDWAERLEKKGAVVWYRYCPVNILAVEDPENVETYDTFLRNAISFPIIGNPQNSLMDAEWFYDTNFHLNSAGKTVNTVQLIRDIKAMLGDDTAVTIKLPEMPQRNWGESDRNKRIWTADDTMACKGKDTIVIPKEVTQIEDYAFAETPELKNIVMNQKDPSKCMVGQHLLDGTKAQIVVTGEALDSYKRNYFWSVYADRIVKIADDAEK